MLFSTMAQFATWAKDRLVKWASSSVSSSSGSGGGSIASTAPPGGIASTNTSPVQKSLRDAAMLIALSTQRCFARAHDPQGRPWPPLKYRIGRPLIKTARMLNLVLEQIKHPRINANSITFSVTQPFYAIFHQEGTWSIPARSYLGLSNEVLEELKTKGAQNAVFFIIG